MVAIKNILFFVATASALTLGKRDASTILSDISTIDSDVNAVTRAANNYNGGLFNALPIMSASNTLDKAINQGTKDAQATSQLSSADSTSIEDAISSLIPDIDAALTALENKKAKFQADGLTSTVENTLETLHTDTDSFANALIAIAAADTVDRANSLKATIDNDFQTAINDFSS